MGNLFKKEIKFIKFYFTRLKCYEKKIRRVKESPNNTLHLREIRVRNLKTQSLNVECLEFYMLEEEGRKCLKEKNGNVYIWPVGGLVALIRYMHNIRR